MAIGRVTKTMLALGALTMAFSGLVSTAYAQRNSAYAAARAAGLVGEQTNGYLGIVGQPTPELLGIVKENTAQRKKVYTARAIATASTVEQYAFTAGCEAIAATVPGEKYQAPDGSWQTRTDAPPIRDSRCTLG